MALTIIEQLQFLNIQKSYCAKLRLLSSPFLCVYVNGAPVDNNCTADLEKQQQLPLLFTSLDEFKIFALFAPIVRNCF